MFEICKQQTVPAVFERETWRIIGAARQAVVCRSRQMWLTHFLWLKPCRSRWNVGHITVFSIQLCSVLLLPSSSSCMPILLSTSSQDLFSVSCSLVVSLYLFGQVDRCGVSYCETCLSVDCSNLCGDCEAVDLRGRPAPATHTWRPTGPQVPVTTDLYGSINARRDVRSTSPTVDLASFDAAALRRRVAVRLNTAAVWSMTELVAARRRRIWKHPSSSTSVGRSYT